MPLSFACESQIGAAYPVSEYGRIYLHYTLHYCRQTVAQITLKPGYSNCHKINRSHLEKLFCGTGPFELLTVETSMFQMQLPRDNCTAMEMREVGGHILYDDSMEHVPVRWLITGPKKKKTILLTVRIPTPDDPAEQRNACAQVLTGIEKMKKQFKLKPHGQQSNFEVFMRESMKDASSKRLEKHLQQSFPVWLGVTLLHGECLNIAARGVPVLSKHFLMSHVPGCEAVRPLNSSSKVVLQFPLTTPTPAALVHDLPLGVRVLLSSVGHRRRSELVLTPDPSLVSAGSSSYVPVGLRKPEDAPSELEPLKFKLTCDSTSWVAVSGSSETSCRVDTRSLVGRTSHLGTDPAHGVAASALYLGEEGSFVILGNLTLFPRGQWIERGRYCLEEICGESVDESDDSDSTSNYLVESESDSDDEALSKLGGKQSTWKDYAEELKACIREDHIPMSARQYRGHVKRNLKLLDGIFGEIRNDPSQHHLEQIAMDLGITNNNAAAKKKSNDDNSDQRVPQLQQSKSQAPQHHDQLKPDQSKKLSQQHHDVELPAEQSAAASSSPKGLIMTLLWAVIRYFSFVFSRNVVAQLTFRSRVRTPHIWQLKGAV